MTVFKNVVTVIVFAEFDATQVYFVAKPDRTQADVEITYQSEGIVMRKP